MAGNQQTYPHMIWINSPSVADGRALARFGLNETLREDAALAVAALQQLQQKNAAYRP